MTFPQIIIEIISLDNKEAKKIDWGFQSVFSKVKTDGSGPFGTFLVHPHPPSSGAAWSLSFLGPSCLPFRAVLPRSPLEAGSGPTVLRPPPPLRGRPTAGLAAEEGAHLLAAAARSGHCHASPSGFVSPCLSVSRPTGVYTHTQGVHHM